MKVISYPQLVMNEGGIQVQKGMNFAIKKSYSIVLMSTEKNAPYNDSMLEDGVIEYEGHDAPLEVGREIGTIYSSGSIQTFSFGFNYDMGENWILNAASSYTPLDVQRPNDTSGNDNFWNVRVGLTIRY